MLFYILHVKMFASTMYTRFFVVVFLSKIPFYLDLKIMSKKTLTQAFCKILPSDLSFDPYDPVSNLTLMFCTNILSKFY